MKVFTRISSLFSPAVFEQVRATKLIEKQPKPSLTLKSYLSVAFFVMMLLSASVSRAQLLTENFSYTAATALTSNGWVAHSSGINPIQITTPGLTYAGHPGSGVGNAITLSTNGEDDSKTFTAVTTGTVYASCLVNLSAAQATGDYFLGLLTSSTTFPLRVYAKSTAGGFFFGLAKGSGAAVYETTVRTTGTTYLLAMSYKYNASTLDDVVNLWVNPALGGTEPAATIPNVNGAIADAATIGSFYVRQGNASNAPTPQIDAILVATTWALVTPGGIAPVINSALTATATVGTPFSYTITAANNPTSFSSSTTLPVNGLSLTGAVLSGTPTTATAPGTQDINIQATNPSGSDSKTLAITVNKGNQTIAGFATTDTKTFGIAPYNITGVTGGGSGNTVTYVSDNPAVADVVGTLVTIYGAGTAHITASQAGNANWNAAANVIQTLTVGKASQAITFAALPNRNDVDANFQLTGSASSGLSLTYVSSNTAIVQIVNAGGTPDVNGDWVDIIGPGTATITASQVGNTNYFAASDVVQSQTIINTSLLPQTITFGALSNKTYGDADFQLTATGGGSTSPVTYMSSDPSVATIVGVNGDYVHIVGPGTTTITASQAGDVNYNPAVPVPQSFTVDKKTLTVSGATVDTKVYNGTTAANISSATLNGIVGVDVVNFATTAGTFADPNVANGIAVTAALTLGGADAVKYLLTQPTGLAGNITKATQTINFTALINKSVGDANFNLTATATSSLPVSYTSSLPSVASVTGTLVHIVAVGSTTITASQAGNQNYFAAISVQQTQTVVPPIPVSIFANVITDGNPSAANPFTAGQTFNGNITVGGIGRGTGITASSASNRYSAIDWTLAAATDPNDYFEFVLTPNTGSKIDFSSLVISHQRSTTGPVTYVLRSSQDSYATNIATGSTPTTATTISIPLSSFINITSAIHFRWYAYGGTATGGSYSVNDFIFNGNVTLAPATVAYVKTNVSACGGSNDGTITVTPAGTGPFSYSWTGVTGSGNPATGVFPDPGNVSSLTGLPIGYYNVTVTDGNLNTTTVTGIHIEYAFLVYITNNGSISSACGNTGSIILYGNAGVQPYTYSLDGVTYQAGNSFTNLAANTYTAYVKDAIGCVNTKSITVTAAAPIVVSPFVRNASACGPDGSIEVYRSGGIPPYTYSKDGTNYVISNVFSALAAGSYTVYVKDSKGCVNSAPATVTQGAALTAVANKTNTSLCTADGSIQLVASGGTGPYTYSIDNGVSYQASSSFSNLSANTYQCVVKDSKGCTGTVNATINLNPITVTAYAGAASSCASADGVIQLFRTGGVGPYTYSLDGNTYQNSNTFTGLIPNYYEGYVKDSKGCVGQLIDIYIGPACGQRGTTLTKGTIVKESLSKVEVNNTLKVQAYPNPTASEFILNLQGYSNDRISIIVTDIMGRVVFQTTGNGKQQYRFGNKFNAGLYNVQVIQGTEKKTIKLIKE
ncbi:hypothetical protein BH11BAC4_BH11BAC4_13090 [soil metagenome]